MKKLAFFILMICISIFTFGCFNYEEAIITTKNEITVEVGDEFSLPIIANENIILAYSFSRNNIVSLTNNTFKAINEGEVVITCYSEKNKDNKVQIKVIVNLTRDISLTHSSVSLIVGDEFTLPIELKNLSYNDLAYSLSNNYTVSVSQGFKITALRKGVVTLTVYYVDNPDVKVDVEITVNNKKEIKLLTNSVTIKVNETSSIPIELVEISYDELDFTISNEEIITIENNLIRGLKVGSTSLIVSYKKDASIFIKVDVHIEKQNYTINDYEYWLENLDPKYNKDAIILNSDEINQLNSIILSNYNNTKVMDITKQPKTRSKDYVYGLINAYAIMDKYPVYNDITKTVASQSDKQQILNNRNLNSIPNEISVSYGIISEFAAVRSYPTYFYSEGYLLDRFQETAFNVGEGVLIYHYSLDGKWAFVQGRNYNGWVEVKNIAICTYDELKSFLNDPNFIIVIDERLNILGVDVRMGQKIPYVSKTIDNYLLKFPTRNNNGYLEIKNVLVSNDEKINEGYLEYTIENILKQAFKILGFDYSWGDKFIDGRDCSSTLNSIFTCFGFMMPRNTSNQSNIPSHSIKVTNLTTTELKNNYMVGTFVFSPGHVLMYIGTDEYGNPYVFHNTNSGTPHCRVQSISSYGISKINAITTFYN